MNAATKQDFGAFLAYIDSYSLSAVGHDPAKVAHVRLAHAQFLALLTIAAELLSDSGSVRDEFESSYGEAGKRYFGEVVSDCSEFVMCMLQGLCRSAGGTLRSGIESYLKAFSAVEKPSILQRTSVPDVFNDAAGTFFFSTVVGKKVLGDLKTVYGELNYYVHTVSPAQMFGALAVGSFPRWSDKNERLIDLFVRTVRLFLYGVIGARRDVFDQFDHRNKVIVNRSMTRQQRRSAMGVDD
ncbi:hypothetical protein [Dyella sp. A6]|uniref:hypothetical protein n=1 Tax=Dyella aluminiiresistens TaxID=3069105 RepID=UPI002E79CF75|nr:hypothetical protein [Dyella sp. A6]